MRLEIELPDRVWGHLVSKADAQGITSRELVTAALEGLVPAVSGRDALSQLWSQGMSDAEIGAALGWTNSAVAAMRRRKHLPANKRVWKEGK
ncbi:hypothetical protein GCM10009748_23320 [Agromyces lapidis]